MTKKLNISMTELENANKKLTEDVVFVQKLEKQRHNFFAAVSYELKTPITIIKGQLESMIMGIGDYKNYEKYLPQTLTTVENMEHLVKEILAVSKMETMGLEGIKTEIYLCDMITECINNTRPLAEEKQISIKTEYTGTPIILAHQGLIKKVFSTLID